MTLMWFRCHIPHLTPTQFNGTLTMIAEGGDGGGSASGGGSGDGETAATARSTPRARPLVMPDTFSGDW